MKGVTRRSSGRGKIIVPVYEIPRGKTVVKSRDCAK